MGWQNISETKVGIAIILGNDHTNTLGVVQCLGRAGIHTIVFVWGIRTGLVSSSSYTGRVHSAKDACACIDLMLQLYGGSKEKIPVIACCDTAAIILDKNRQRLENVFTYEYSAAYALEFLARKENQIKLAAKVGFNVPKTLTISENSFMNEDISFPCLIKPIVSCRGAKSDIRVCNDREELYRNISTLEYTEHIILQEYIDHDYEISILGCGLRNGDVIIPCTENKLSLYPSKTGLECVANVQPDIDLVIKENICSLIKEIGYIGLFSVELMHNRNDGKFYFTEINLRNDGANGFIYKYGVNLPLNHIEDLLEIPLTVFSEFRPGYYIWEMHHFMSLIHRETSFINWIKDLGRARGFLTWLPDDRRPFYRQFFNSMLHMLHIRNIEYY